MSEPIRRADALAYGQTDAELRSLYTRQGWSKLRPGLYVPPEFEELTREAKHRELVVATAPLLSALASISHQSAAVMHDVPLWSVPFDRVHATRDRPAGGRKTRHLHMHCAPLPDEDVVVIDGVRVTDLARTVCDLARTVPLEQAIVAGDAAMRKGLTRNEIVDGLAYAEGRHGFRRAQLATQLFDGRSESVGESRSRLALSQLRLPTPQLQTEFFDNAGVLLGRGDFFIEEFGVIGEFDGKVKYGKYLRPGVSPGEAVYREKLREDSLRDMGWEVVRWIWSELERRDVIHARFQRAITRRKHAQRPLGTYRLAA